MVRLLTIAIVVAVAGCSRQAPPEQDALTLPSCRNVSKGSDAREFIFGEPTAPDALPSSLEGFEAVATEDFMACDYGDHILLIPSDNRPLIAVRVRDGQPKTIQHWQFDLSNVQALERKPWALYLSDSNWSGEPPKEKK